MTAKEKLRELVDELSEAEAAKALEVLIARRGEQRDALMEFLDNAPLDDEPTTPEEEALVAEANADIAAGRTIPLDEILREFE